MRNPLTLTTLLACVLALALPAEALANATDDRIVADCQHSQTGELTGRYTKAQLRHAKDNLPSDVLEYSGCYDAINQALLASGGSGGGGNPSGGGPQGGGANGGGSGGAGGPSAVASGAGGIGAPDEAGSTPANATPPASATRPVAVAGTAVAPGALPELGRDAHRLPTALLVGLVLLGAAALVPAALTIGRRVARRAP